LAGAILAEFTQHFLGGAWRDWLDPRSRPHMAVLDLTR
jgi:hypothetical protein